MRVKTARDLKHEALVSCSQGRNQADVAQEYGMDRKTIQRAATKFREHGDIEGGAQKRGPKGKLDANMVEVFHSLCMFITSDVDRNGSL
jgi:transposase